MEFGMWMAESKGMGQRNLNAEVGMWKAEIGNFRLWISEFGPPWRDLIGLDYFPLN